MKNSFYIFLLLLMGCSVQKRRYQGGFYISRDHSSQHTLKPAKSTASQKTEEKQLRSLIGTQDNLTGHGFNTTAPQNPDSCDLLVFYDGTEIKARIIEINRSEIKYRYCDDKTQTVRTARRTSIVNINYSNGTKEGVTPAPRKVEPVVSEEKTGEFKQADTVRSASAPLVKDTVPPKKGSCDNITFRDGTEMPGKVVEIGISEIRYKACDMPDGPTFVKNKSSVFMIVYGDGHREVFKEEVEVVKENLNNYQRPIKVKEKKGLAINAFIFSLLGIFPLYLAGSVAGLIMAVIYNKKAKLEPEVYTATKTSKAAMVISIIVISIYAMIIIIASLGI